MARPASSASSALRRTTGFSIYVLATLLRRIAARRRSSVPGPATRARSAPEPRRGLRPMSSPNPPTRAPRVRASAGAADKPDSRQHRQVEEVVAHERNLPNLRVRPAGRSPHTRPPCVRPPARRCGSRAGPRAARWRLTFCADRKPTESPARCAHTSAAPSRMWKLFDSDPSACMQHRAVGQHAVDVEEQEPHCRRLRLH